MKRKKASRTKGAWLGLAAAVAAALLSLGDGWAAEKSRRIGILLPNDEWASSVDGFKEGMELLRYGEGRDVRYLSENAKGDKARVTAITRKFIADKVDLIYTVTNTALKVVVEETKATKVPVVFGSASGPVESGILPAYSTPDTNITGVTSGSIELVAKRLEILREILPKAARVAAIGDGDSDSSKLAFVIAAKAAGRLKLELIERRVNSTAEAVEAGNKITAADADALFLIPGLYGVGAAGSLAKAALVKSLPFGVYQIEHVRKDGALFSYGSSYFFEGKQAAALADKIFKGVPIPQLPIERAISLQLTLNLATAKKLGVKLSPALLHRADELVGTGGD